MKPIAILQFSQHVEAGHFATFLRQQSRPFVMIRVDLGDEVPTEAKTFSGICLLGGEMSVNDPLPWIPSVLDLIRTADVQGIPLIGHCLGGQLISKALGAVVSRNPVKEIGWGLVYTTNTPAAREWLLDAPGQPVQQFSTFQWHGETFELPTGAELLLTNPFCQHQAYILRRPNGVVHLAMQFHIEMTADLVRRWAAQGHHEILREIERTGGPATQQPEQMLENLAEKITLLNQQAECFYMRWLTNQPKLAC